MISCQEDRAIRASVSKVVHFWIV